jgi:GNAT superfamily N-acetyltransferase
MSVKREIVDSTGQVCGHLETTLCYSEQDLDECIRFSNIPGGFAQYRAQIPLAEIWPMAVLNDIEVYPAYRKRRLARNILEQFLIEARQYGARTAFLRVGWSGNDPDAERAWRVDWYSRMGFIELQNTAPHLAIPFMYRAL